VLLRNAFKCHNAPFNLRPIAVISGVEARSRKPPDGFSGALIAKCRYSAVWPLYLNSHHYWAEIQMFALSEKRRRSEQSASRVLLLELARLGVAEVRMEAQG
jgi:hypothetical protein